MEIKSGPGGGGELNSNTINLMRTYFDPNVLRQSWERWRWIIVCDVRNILVEKIFAIPASRGLCFLDVVVARLKNEWIFSASVAWNQIQAADRDQRKYAQKRNKHSLVFRCVKLKWLSTKPSGLVCQKNFSTMTVNSSRAYVSSSLSIIVLLVELLLLRSNMRGVGHLSRFLFSVKRSHVFSSDPLDTEGCNIAGLPYFVTSEASDTIWQGGGFRINFNIVQNPLGWGFSINLLNENISNTSELTKLFSIKFIVYWKNIS